MCCHVLEQAVLQGCKQVFGVSRPRQVVPPAPKQTLECGPRLAPRLDSLAPGASPMRHSKWLPVTCCPVSYSNTRQSFNPEYYRLVQAASNIIPNRPRETVAKRPFSHFGRTWADETAKVRPPVSLRETPDRKCPATAAPSSAQRNQPCPLALRCHHRAWRAADPSCLPTGSGAN